MGLAFSVINLIVKAVKVLRKKGENNSLAKWGMVASINNVVIMITIVIMTIKVQKIEALESYFHLIILLFLLLITTISMALYGCKRVLKLSFTKKLSKRVRIYYYTIIFFQIVSIVNLVYWNLMMFWKI